ncbi:McrB family protein [Bathymodiolus thermophilus thioautotrophic gill symbiont]|uniref:ATPase dynein-related AAA domain-containing protein n=1 Tax=Bathymodiolus thermophilus thioautotrophic gill symbiont TaxID=2360 RepID=A0A1J5ULR2_9GAMM|nr:AAA family ATPase [Bathymodiolus thermophilus thioautotrophic gill symbiont]OIR25183.1 hypothetical protein BGC33_05675 [Bathymodiolus thermophilus thioautotrophic gill symbiont]
MEQLKKQFLEKWSLEQVKNMTLDEYTSTKSEGRRNDFTFWIENKMSDVINFESGSSEKFGIYLRSNKNTKIKEKDKRKTDGNYTWYKKYGDSKKEAFQKVKEIIVSVIQYAQNQEFKKIDDVDLGSGYKWIIAYYYAPEDTLLRIVSKDAFKYLSKAYFDEELKKISEIQKELIAIKPEDLSFDQYSKKLYKEYKDSGFVVKGRQINNEGEGDMNTQLNQILYGPPGTGKTYSTVNKALDILLGENHNSGINSIGKLKEKFGSQVEFVTFHQSFSYEDFVEGLKAKTDDGDLSYEIESGIFKEICENSKGQQKIKFKLDGMEFNDYLTVGQQFITIKGQGFEIVNIDDKIKIKNSKDKEYTLSRNSILEYLKRQDFHETHGHYSYQPKIAKYIFEKIDKNSLEESVLKPHVLIIDEINRGNISRIFGELITLIEPSKRAGESEVISVKLPYSKEDFSVPNNLYIIGTMNTADRSLTMMDTALRRRFDFIEMAPDVGLVKGDFDGIKVGKILEFINKRIEILYDREHLIGHSFLMNIDDLSGLKNAFKNKILPLLEEYFYDDFENIRKVLNDKKGKFYQKIEVDESLFFGNENIQKDSYKKANIDELTAEDFQQIYKNKDE